MNEFMRWDEFLDKEYDREFWSIIDESSRDSFKDLEVIG